MPAVLRCITRSTNIEALLTHLNGRLDERVNLLLDILYLLHLFLLEWTHSVKKLNPLLDLLLNEGEPLVVGMPTWIYHVFKPFYGLSLRLKTVPLDLLFRLLHQIFEQHFFLTLVITIY